MKDNKEPLLFRMVLGTVGLIIFVIGFIMMLDKNNPDSYGHLIAIFGFSIFFGYIDFLETKVGISAKYSWARFFIIGVVLIVAFYFIQPLN